jgi:hypothetical protein
MRLSMLSEAMPTLRSIPPEFTLDRPTPLPKTGRRPACVTCNKNVGKEAYCDKCDAGPFCGEDCLGEHSCVSTESVLKEHLYERCKKCSTMSYDWDKCDSCGDIVCNRCMKSHGCAPAEGRSIQRRQTSKSPGMSQYY